MSKAVVPRYQRPRLWPWVVGSVAAFAIAAYSYFK